MATGEEQQPPSHGLAMGGEYVTFREAVTMFVSKAEFDKFSSRIEGKLDTLLAQQLPRWVWYVLGLLMAFVAPLAAALLTHWLSRF